MCIRDSPLSVEIRYKRMEDAARAALTDRNGHPFAQPDVYKRQNQFRVKIYDTRAEMGFCAADEAAAAILAPAGGPPYVRAVTFGRVRDYNCLLYTSRCV